MTSVRPIEPTSDAMPAALARMPGPSPWFVAACMGVISFALAAVLYLQAGFSLTEAGATGFSTLMVMLLAEFFTARRRERATVERELQAISETATTLGRDTASATRRIAALEASIGEKIDDAVEGQVALLTAELQELEMSLGAMREEVASLRAGNVRARASAPAQAAAAPTGALDGLERAQALDILRRAVAEDRVEVFLQPIVSLPQRRVCHYEALARLRGETGGFLLPADFMALAESEGLAPRIDAAVAERCIAIAGHLAQRNPEMSLFCNLSAASLTEGPLLQRLIEAFEQDGSLSSRLVLEFRQPAFDSLGPLETAGVQALNDAGLRLSVDGIRDLDIDGRAWASRRVRFAKVGADILLNPPAGSGADIHVADLARFLARSGIELVASRIEGEADLVDLLDYDIGFGQGYLFSPPRPVRSTFLEPATGHGDGARMSRMS